MTVIRSLGLQRTRSKRLVLLSKMYLDDPPIPDVLRPSYFLSYLVNLMRQLRFPHLPGSGAYALDSYTAYSTPVTDPTQTSGNLSCRATKSSFAIWYVYKCS